MGAGAERAGGEGEGTGWRGEGMGGAVGMGGVG